MIAGGLPVLLAIATASAAPSRFAVVVGENRAIRGGVEALQFADDDAVLTAALLEEAGVDVTLLVTLDDDSQRLFGGVEAAAPTAAGLRLALRHVFDRIREQNAAGRSTEFLFVYSGHGDVEEGVGYVALADGRLTRNHLHEDVIERSPAAKNHVIVDACRSYAVAFERGPGGQRSAFTLPEKSTRDRYPNTGFVLSSSSNRDTHEWTRFGAGVFSHEVRSGLRGAADADADGRITYSELGAFIETANAGIPNAKYRPDAVVIPPKDDEEGAMLAWATEPFVVPPEATLGHMYLEDADGNRLVDGHVEATTALVLRIPPRRPLFLRDDANTGEYTITATSAMTLARTDLRPRKVAKRGAESVAFEKLFSKPFSRLDVRSYTTRRARWSQVVVEYEVPNPIHRVSPWVAGSAAAIGFAATAWASFERKAVTHETLGETNQRIVNLNRVAGAAYILAGTAFVTWLVFEVVGAID